MNEKLRTEIEENSPKFHRPLEKLINQNFKREIPLKVKIRREAKKSKNEENPAIFVKFIFNALFHLSFGNYLCDNYLRDNSRMCSININVNAFSLVTPSLLTHLRASGI